MAPDFRRKRSTDRDDTAAPVLITAARESYRDELAARKRRYFLLMGIRIPALLLAAGSLALWNNPWIALAIVGGSIPLPWIAVIGANDRPPLPKGQARRYSAGALSNHTPYALPSGVTGMAGSAPSSSAPGADTPSDRTSSERTPTDATPGDRTSDDTTSRHSTPTPDESDPAP
ncbi:DUF3099 domain-containing protein [Rhodococcus sp. IEGM 1408]|uniref:DUF3099 domain-containing protein n=1 Tax=Rhodococcus sp. IEGM 1408 TaxID=3082220 RepID=UPI002955CC82|nr:DUF3099 domain-containing protein [Rhodococcus sp. IEGM 1408]MDV8002711.1 DUF3099 domain-containing protein [Rhodococcus sp. IEGM 1408]